MVTKFVSVAAGAALSCSSRDAATRSAHRDITFPDGKKLFVGSSGTGAPDERPEK